MCRRALIVRDNHEAVGLVFRGREGEAFPCNAYMKVCEFLQMQHKGVETFVKTR